MEYNVRYIDLYAITGVPFIQARLYKIFLGKTSDGLIFCFQKRSHGMKIFPLAIPTHTLEPRKKDPLDVRWDVLRMQCTWLRISMDFNTSRTLPCPWQLVLPEKSRDERVRVTELRSLMRDVCRWRSLAMAQCMQGKLVGPIRSHRSQKLIQALRRWTLDRHWPSWRQTEEVQGSELLQRGSNPPQTELAS